MFSFLVVQLLICIEFVRYFVSGKGATSGARLFENLFDASGMFHMHAVNRN